MELQQPFGGHEEVIADTLRMKASKDQVEVLAAAAGLSDPPSTFMLLVVSEKQQSLGLRSLLVGFSSYLKSKAS